MVKSEKFWETVPFDQLNSEQWESICDGCGQCCAYKLECDETEELFYTNIVCKHLDHKKCQCGVYGDRHTYVPDCIKITPENASQLAWIPETCGYKRLAKGLPLPDWHPLITGDPLSPHKANMTINNKVISEDDINIDDLEDYVVDDDYFTNLCKSIGANIN